MTYIMNLLGTLDARKLGGGAKEELVSFLGWAD
jgi:hypothetical protein